MQWQWSLWMLVLLGSQALAQEPPPGTPGPTAPVFAPREMTGTPEVLCRADGSVGIQGGRLSGNHNFPNFAVYTTSIASQRDFNVNGLLVKMVYRY